MARPSAFVAATVVGFVLPFLECAPARVSSRRPVLLVRADRAREAAEVKGEACGACPRQRDWKHRDFLERLLCGVNAVPNQLAERSAETIRITREFGLLELRGDSRDPPRYRGWSWGLRSLTLERRSGLCTGELATRWHRTGQCEIARIPVRLSVPECDALFDCVRAAIPLDSDVSQCEPGLGGTDGDFYAVELLGPRDYGACVGEANERLACAARVLSEGYGP